MKKIVLALVAFLSFKSFSQTTYKADIETSKVAWESKKVNGSHDGTLSISEGTFVFENDILVGGNFVLDMNSITALDVKGIKRRKLVKHLKSDDFFDVRNHPKGNYKITGSESKDGKTLVKGKLTVKGITHDVNFLATITNTDGKISFTSDDFNIDRTKWDIKYRSGKFFDNLKNKMIYDDIKIGVKISAMK